MLHYWLVAVMLILLELLTACAPPMPPQVGEISIHPSSPMVRTTATATVDASGTDLQFKWTVTRGFVASNALPSVTYTAPDSPGPATITVEVIGRGGSTFRSITFEVIVPTPTATPTRTPALTPVPIRLFQDFEENNGTPPGAGNYFWDTWFTSCDFNPPNVQAFQGARAGCCRAFAQEKGHADDHGGTMGINAASRSPLDLSSAGYIGIYIYDTQGANTVELKLRDGNDKVSTSVWSAKKAQQNQWTLITWPLTSFGGVDKSRIKNIELYEWNDGFYCFDYVFFQ